MIPSPSPPLHPRYAQTGPYASLSSPPSSLPPSLPHLSDLLKFFSWFIRRTLAYVTLRVLLFGTALNSLRMEWNLLIQNIITLSEE
ncbi:hypothetical protein ACTXT7_010818 [Hymenolepis weldensis]